MFDAVHRFISNPNPTDGFTLLMIIIATAIVGMIAYKMAVMRGRSWYKNSMLHLGAIVEMPTTTGSVIGTIISDTSDQLRILVRMREPRMHNMQVKKTILVSFTGAMSKTWVMISPDDSAGDDAGAVVEGEISQFFPAQISKCKCESQPFKNIDETED